MKTLIKSAIIGLALAGVAQATPSSYVTQNLTQNVTTTVSSFTFSQFNPTSGSLSAVDLIFNSSVVGGNFTLSRSSGSATFTSLGVGLFVEAGEDILLETDPLKSISASPSSGNNTFTSTPKVFNVGPSQSLLDSTPYTLNINSLSWGFFEGSGSALLDVTLIADALTSTNSNMTKSYGNMFAPTSLTLRYTYTPASPSPVPETGQVAASLLLLGGIGGYIFIKRRRKPAVAAA